MSTQNSNLLIIDPYQDLHIIKGLASEIRVNILQKLQDKSMNINELSAALNLPQSTVATNILTLEKCGLVSSKMLKASKGNQKICSANFEEFIIRFQPVKAAGDDIITVEMPIGLYIHYSVSPPCGLCSTKKIIGFLDAPESFLEPSRVKAGLLWFEKGSIQYQFPNNALNHRKKIKKMEISMELSSETPGTNPTWKSDIFLSVNSKDVGFWTSPGDYGDKRGKLTPFWWKLEGSQYGLLTNWAITQEGTFIGDNKISPVTINDLDIYNHHSIKVTIGVKDDAENVGGINIFGKGFGNHDQDIVMKLFF